MLDTVADQHRALEHNPGDREALVTVRRQFHTLKGSGRMVGLTELGELAWGVERIHNRLLEEDRRVTPAVIALIGVAQTSFRQWVKELRETGRFATDPAPLQAALRAVEAELPGGAAAAMPLPPVSPSGPCRSQAPGRSAGAIAAVATCAAPASTSRETFAPFAATTAMHRSNIRRRHRDAGTAPSVGWPRVRRRRSSRISSSSIFRSSARRSPTARRPTSR